MENPCKMDIFIYYISMMKRQLLTAIYCLSAYYLLGQNCTPSTDKNKHVVQAGETLFSLSRQYNVSVDNIRKWNNLKPDAMLYKCTTLWVASPENLPKSEVAASETRPNPRDEKNPSSFVFPTNEIHTVAKGETLASIAKKYGYTEERLRAMNNLQPTQVVKQGQELYVSGCGLCGKTASTKPQNSPAASTKPTSEKPVSAGLPPVSYNGVTPGSYDETDINKLIELNESYSGASAFPKVVHVVSQGESLGLIAQLYGMSEAEIMQMNGLQKGSQIFQNQKLLVEDRKDGKWEPIYSSQYSTETTTVETSPVDNESYLPPVSTEPTVEVEAPVVIGEVPASEMPVNTNTPQPSETQMSMNQEELEMFAEINLLRKNPAGYAVYVETYIKELQARNELSAIKSARELITELKKTPKLPVLEAKDCVYLAAQKHGEEQRTRGTLNYDGLDGTWPWDRLMRECPEVQDGNENLIGGVPSVRTAVLMLLVDDGIDGRGHRKTLLSPDWRYGACYKIGTVGSQVHCWTQEFAY